MNRSDFRAHMLPRNNGHVTNWEKAQRSIFKTKQSTIDQVFSIKMAGYWPSSFFASLWTETAFAKILLAGYSPRPRAREEALGTSV